MGTFFHYGIANGLGEVIHNSKRRAQVVEESYDEFSGGREIIISELTSDNPIFAVNIARRYIGMPYDLFKANCEQFVRMCHGMEIESTQIQQYTLMALGAGVALKGNNDLLRVAGGAVAFASLLTPAEESPYKNAAVAALVAVGIVALAK